MSENNSEIREPEYNSHASNEQDDKENISCIFSLIVPCGMLVLRGISIFWFVFSIITLSQTSNQDIHDTCSGSNLWISLLIAVIGNGLAILDNICGKKDEHGQHQPNVIIVGINIGALIFVTVEVYKTCALDNLSETIIYQLQFWLIVVVYSIYSIIILVGCCCCCLSQESKPTVIKIDQTIDNIDDIFIKMKRSNNNINTNMVSDEENNV
jgi:hypothetical protein